MATTMEQLAAWMDAREDEHLEFKEAKQNFHFEKLVKYCVALANEGGGTMILGVTDKRPRRVVGSQAFDQPERTVAGVIERLRLKVEAEEIAHPNGRVVVFHVPSRPLGVPVSYEGAYWMRGGEDLVPMTPDQLKRIMDEAGPDFSAEVCAKAQMTDLDTACIEDFRQRWIRKARGSKSGGSLVAALTQCSPQQLLADAELLLEGRLTYASLILFGTRQALGRHLAQAEVIFEYRGKEASGPADQREEFRQGFYAYYDELWRLVNLRNDRQHFRDGLFVQDIPTFNEDSVREAILNAVSHRDYRHAGSVFVRQFQRRLEVVSPGGFPPGVTPENILDRQLPRNRRLADAFEKCGLVERSGQGANRMFEACILEAKPLPDFTGTDAHQVSLILHGQVQDVGFLRFLEKVGQERLRMYSTHDLLALDLIHRNQPLPETVRQRVPRLMDDGLVERSGRGKFILSRQFHAFLGKKGAYTRRKGLDRETNKALLLKHIQDDQAEGSQLRDLAQVLPALSHRQVQGLLRELRSEGRIHSVGRTNAGRWYPGPEQSTIAPKPK